MAGEGIGLGGLVTGHGGVAGNVLDGCAHFIDGGGNHVSLALLGNHAVLDAGHQPGHFVGALFQLACGKAHGADDFLLSTLHGVEGPGHGPDLITAGGIGAQGEVPGVLHSEHDITQGTDIGCDEGDQDLRHGQHCEHQHQHQHQHQHRVQGSPLDEQC